MLWARAITILVHLGRVSSEGKAQVLRGPRKKLARSMPPFTLLSPPSRAPCVPSCSTSSHQRRTWRFPPSPCEPQAWPPAQVMGTAWRDGGSRISRGHRRRGTETRGSEALSKKETKRVQGSKGARQRELRQSGSHAIIQRAFQSRAMWTCGVLSLTCGHVGFYPLRIMKNRVNSPWLPCAQASWPASRARRRP